VIRDSVHRGGFASSEVSNQVFNFEWSELNERSIRWIQIVGRRVVTFKKPIYFSSTVRFVSVYKFINFWTMVVDDGICMDVEELS